MGQVRVRPSTANRLLTCLLIFLLAGTVVVAAQRVEGHPHTLRPGAAAALNTGDTGHAATRVAHDAAPARVPSSTPGQSYPAAPLHSSTAFPQATAGFRPVRGPPSSG